MTRALVLIGAGGHGTVVLEVLLVTGQQVLGVCDPALPRGASGPLGQTVLGGDEAVATLSPDEVLLVNGVGSIGLPTARDEVFRRFAARGYRFATVVHPGALVSPHAVLEEGCQLMAGAVVQCGARVGADSIVNTRASVDHDSTLGRSVHVAPGAILCGEVRVGDLCHIGAGATVLQNVTLPDRTLVQAGSLVARSPVTRKRAAEARGASGR
jgi:sugar O-acyltransferase (sialic acid O-acetyltransferase NeuD family)